MLLENSQYFSLFKLSEKLCYLSGDLRPLRPNHYLGYVCLSVLTAVLDIIL